MRYLCKIFIAISLFFTLSPAYTQVRDGQIISRALALGEGRSVPLPPGKWAVKHYPLPSNNASSMGYFLQNQDAQSEIPLIFVNETLLFANSWSASVFTPIQNSFLVEFYGTSSSSIETKISSVNSMNLKSVKSFFENFKYDINSISLEANQGEYLNDDFLLLDTRVINLKSRVRLVSLVRLKSKFDSSSASQTGQIYETLKQWNARTIQALSSSYNRKSPLSISYVFNEINDSIEEIKITENNISNQSQKNNKTENENANPVNPLSSLLEQFRLAQGQVNEASRASENSTNEKVQAAQREKEKLEAAVNQKQLEAQRQEEELRAKEREKLAQIEKESQEQKRKQEALAAEAENKLKEQSRLASQSVKKALVFGNNNYSNVSQLAMAVSDSAAMANRLKALGYRVTLANNGNRSQMLSSVRQFKQNLSPKDEVIFYYAGHGVQIGQSNYLLPVDIAGESEDQIKDDALALDRVLEDFDEKGVKFTLAIVDACRDNPFRANAKRGIGGTRGLAPANSANGQIIIFSAGAGQTALDNLGPSDREKNGVFTRVLLDEMNKSDESIDRMIRNVRKRVVELAKSIGHTQVPAIYDQAIGEFYFSK